MYNSVNRLQTTFGSFTTIAFIVATLIALSDFLTPRLPSAGTIIPDSVQVVKGRPHYYSSTKEEYAIIKFSLEADLSSLLGNWNTKQIFVYVTAEWPDSGADPSANATNQAVIWDQIITSPSADHLTNLGPVSKRKLIQSAQGKPVDPSRGKLKIKNQKPKYQITHPSGRLAETENVRLRLHYNVQPWVGFLTWNQDIDIGVWRKLKGGVSELFQLPATKKKQQQQTT